MVIDIISRLHAQGDVVPVEMSISNAPTEQTTYDEVLIEETARLSSLTHEECRLEETSNQVRYLVTIQVTAKTVTVLICWDVLHIHV